MDGANEGHLARDVSVADLLLDTNSGKRTHEVSVETQQRILDGFASRENAPDRAESTRVDAEGRFRAAAMHQKDERGDTPTCEPKDRKLTGFETSAVDSLPERARNTETTALDGKRKDAVNPSTMLVRGLTGLDDSMRKVILERVRLNQEESWHTNTTIEDRCEEVDTQLIY